MTQDPVTAAVAKVVVDLLEIVNVKKCKTCGCVVAGSIGDGPVQLAHKGAPVQDRYKRVFIGHDFQLVIVVFKLVIFILEAVNLEGKLNHCGFDFRGNLRLGDAENSRDIIQDIGGFGGGVSRNSPALAFFGCRGFENSMNGSDFHVGYGFS